MRFKDSFAYKDVGFAKVDTGRALRRGFPEVIFCNGKSLDQLKRIAYEIISSGGPLLMTRLEPQVYHQLKCILPELRYNALAKAGLVKGRANKSKKGQVLIITAGTGDIPVAEEAAVTLEAMGDRYERLYDVGVAGVHRLLKNRIKLKKANVIIVLAGMDGVLASVVGGIVSKPVIAVPTSIGYGASFNGIGPLLTMLNCCAPGVVVVNIDNGFGAGYFASLINK